jgi:LemA protein
MSYAILVVLIVLFLALAILFNQLVRRRTLVKEAWSGIQAQLKLRYDLTPKLVDIVKGYRDHEKSLLTSITEARIRCLSAQGVSAQADAENALSRSLKSLFAVAEAYPDLKADGNFLELQKEMADIEEQLLMSRRYYNGAVRDYNIRVNTFPGLLVSRMFGFQEAAFFQGKEQEAESPQIKF